MLFHFFLGIGFDLHFGSVSFEFFIFSKLCSLKKKHLFLIFFLFLFLGIGETLHLDWVSFESFISFETLKTFPNIFYFFS